MGTQGPRPESKAEAKVNRISGVQTRLTQLVASMFYGKQQQRSQSLFGRL